MEENTTNTTEDIPKIRTFQSDIADALKQQQGSVIKIAVAENERKQTEKINTIQTKKSNVGFIFGGIILLALAGGVGFFLWKKNQTLVYQAPVTLSKNQSLVSFDVSKEIFLDTDSDLFVQIQKALQADQPVSTITKLTLTEQDGSKQKKVLTIPELFQKGKIEIPESVLVSIDQQNYFFGTLSQNSYEKFLVLKTTAFANTFAGLLEWEKTLSQDLMLVLDLEKTEKELSFKDKIIKNEDTRILVDKEEKTYMTYAFFGPKKELLLITKKPETLSSLIERFTTKKIKQ